MTREEKGKDDSKINSQLYFICFQGHPPPLIVHGNLIIYDFHPKLPNLTFYARPISNFRRLTPNHKRIVPLASKGHFQIIGIPNSFSIAKNIKNPNANLMTKRSKIVKTQLL